MNEKANSIPHLLIVDDELPTLKLLELQLETGGFRVTAIDSGVAALEYLQNAERATDPVDAVILDIMMPDMDGFEVLSRIKSNPILMYTPVIVLTCIAGGEDEERALAGGADDFIKKPCEMSEFTSRIQLVLARENSSQSLDLVNRNMKALLANGRALLGIHSLEELLQIILGELKAVVNYNSSSIILLENEILEIVAYTGFRSHSQVFPHEELLKLAHVQEVLRTGQPLIINNTFEDRRWVHLLDSDYIASWMGIPLIVKDKIIGILNVDMDLLDYYSEAAAEIAVGFAMQAALAIEHAKLLKRLERQSSLTKALVDASNKLASTMQLETQLEAIWHFVSEQMHAPMFYVAICDPLRHMLDVKIIYEMGIRQPEMSLSLSESEGPTLSTQVANKGIPIQWRSIEERSKVISEMNISPNIIGSVCSSCLAYPLISDGQVIGVIAIQSNLPHVWDEVDIDIFRALADMVAATTSNSQAFQDIQTDQDRLITAFDASNDMRSMSDPDQILPSIVERLHKMMDCAQVNVALIDERGKPIHYAVRGYSRDIDLPNSIRLNGISSTVIKSGVSKFMDDLSRFTGEVNPDLIGRGTKASACIPLPLGDRIIGVLWVHFDRPHHFTSQEQKTLHLYGVQVAKTYESIRRVNDLERLRRTSESLASTTMMTNIYESIVKIAKEEFRAVSTALWAYDDEQKRFILENSAASGIDPDIWEVFKLAEPQKEEDGTAYIVMDRGWLGISNINSSEDRALIGQSTYELLSSIGIKSFQGITLRDDKEILGVLYINYVEQQSFNAPEREAAQAFASQAAMACKKTRLFDQLEKAKKTAHIVAEHTALGDLSRTLKSIVTGTKTVTNCDTITIYTYNEKEDVFEYPPEMAGVNFPEKVVELDSVEKNSVPYHIVAMNRLYLSENADEDSKIRGKFTEREGIKSFAGVPLISQNIKVGVMCLSFRHTHRFTTSDISSINLIAMQAAVAIQNSLSYKKEREKTEILEALHKASQSIVGLLNEEQILKTIAQQASILTGIHGEMPTSSSIGMLDSSNKIVFKTAFPDGYFANLGTENPIIDLNAEGRIGICGRAIRLGKSQLVADVQGDRDYIAFDMRTNSELAIPIQLGETVIGVINVEHPKKQVFSEEDLQALEMLASHVSIAIQNARTFEELRTTKLNVESLTNLVWAGAFASAWRHSIGNHSVIVSDIVKLIREDLEKGDSMSLVFDKLSHIETVINEIQSIPMLPLSAEDGIESILINQLISDRLKQYRQKNGRFAAITFIPEMTGDSSTTVRASREWLRRLLDILIDNAVNAMINATNKLLVIRSEVEDHHVKVSVIDTGHGISPEIRSKLFENPIMKKKGEKGSGIGLYLAKEIAHTYGGRLEVATTGANGTTMVARLPIEI